LFGRFNGLRPKCLLFGTTLIIRHTLFQIPVTGHY
jgi:hypothetical protein